MQTITVPDGYNGHTVTLNADPIRTEGGCVLLRCAEPGREYLVRWVRIAALGRALEDADRLSRR